MRRWPVGAAGLRRVPAPYLLCLVALALGVGGGLVVVAATSARQPTATAESVVPAAVRVATTTTAPPPLKVHVAGAVAHPGVYQLTSTARVADAIAAAGNARPDADMARINLASPVRDGMRVYLPVVGETPPAVVGPDSGGAPSTAGGSASSSPADGDAQVDLNSATPEQLDTLPGIGPSTAAAIVRHRASQPFTSVDDLLNVPGIGPAKLENLRARVRV
ncbi:MAG: competence protein ComEA [Acidimicrobiia bacterium]|nr:competence protein ComEA [Acidimicrobiia bacterium]